MVCSRLTLDTSKLSGAAQGDIILVGLRDYQDEKADVILKCGPRLLQCLRWLRRAVCHGTLIAWCCAGTWQMRPVVLRPMASCQRTVGPAQLMLGVLLVKCAYVQYSTT